MSNEIDNEPFGARGADVVAGLAQMAGGGMAGEVTRHAVQGKEHAAFRAKVLAWASQRGFAVDESRLVREVDGVKIEIALFDLTESTAVVRSKSIRTASKLSFVVEPKTWTHRLRERFAKRVETGDSSFDDKWSVRTNDPAAAKQLLQDSFREALRELAAVAWCRASYEQGDLEVRVDIDALAGRHLLLAAAILDALARAEISSGVYR